MVGLETVPTCRNRSWHQKMFEDHRRFLKDFLEIVGPRREHHAGTTRFGACERGLEIMEGLEQSGSVTCV